MHSISPRSSSGPRQADVQEAAGDAVGADFRPLRIKSPARSSMKSPMKSQHLRSKSRGGQEPDERDVELETLRSRVAHLERQEIS